jgi:hypothetical protein
MLIIVISVSASESASERGRGLLQIGCHCVGSTQPVRSGLRLGLAMHVQVQSNRSDGDVDSLHYLPGNLPENLNLAGQPGPGRTTAQHPT